MPDSDRPPRLSPEIRVLTGVEALAEAGAEIITRALAAAIAERGRGLMVLAGGTTPRRLYRRLAEPPHRGPADWTRIELFWGDERCVEPGREESNFRTVKEALLDRLPAGPPATHRIRGELAPEEAADLYDRELRSLTEEPPWFDLVLLGLGVDGHTASLFPDRPDLARSERLAVATRSPLPPVHRVSLTPRALASARQVIFVVSGGDKASAVRDVLERRDPRLPASWIRPAESAPLWLLDRHAAERVRGLADRR